MRVLVIQRTHCTQSSTTSSLRKQAIQCTQCNHIDRPTHHTIGSIWNRVIQSALHSFMSQSSQPSRSRSAASQSTDGTYLRFSENSLIPSLPLSSQCTKSEITYYLHCINGFPNSHGMKKLLWKTANYQAIIKIPTLHGHVSQIYYYNETSFIGNPQ